MTNRNRTVSFISSCIFTLGTFLLAQSSHAVALTLSDYLPTSNTILEPGGDQWLEHELLFQNGEAFNAVSSGGVYAVGCAWSPAGSCGKGVRWDGPSGELRSMADLGQNRGEAYAVTDSGVVVGWAENLDGYYVAVESKQQLPLLTNISPSSRAYDVSPDGSVIVGYSRGSLSRMEPTRWILEDGARVVESLGVLSSEHTYTFATAVSDDGGVIVGYGGTSPNFPTNSYAFRWTESSGIQAMDSLPGGTDLSEAHAISADGIYIAGIASSSDGIQFFRWSEGTLMEGLGAMPGDPKWVNVTHISNDGEAIVFDNGYIWTEQHGLRPFSELFEHIYGLDSQVAGDLTVTSISDDGKTLAGSSKANGSFVFRLLESNNYFSSLASVDLASRATELPAQAPAGTIYLVLDDILAAFTPEGEPLWSFDAGGEINYAPSVNAQGEAYIIVDFKTLVKVSAGGQQVWRYAHTSGFRAPALSNDGNLYLSSSDGFIYAISMQGEKVWSYGIGSPILSSVSVGKNNNIYLFSYYKRALISLDSAGNHRWTVDVAGREPYVSPSIGPDGNIYVYFGKEIRGVTPAGILDWSYSDPIAYMRSEPVFDSLGNLYIGAKVSNTEHSVLLINAQAEVIRSYAVGNYVDYSPTLTFDDQLLVSDRDGVLRLFDGEGQLLVEHWARAGKWLLSKEGNLIVVGEALNILATPNLLPSEAAWSMQFASGQRTRNVAYAPKIDSEPVVSIDSPASGLVITDRDGALAFVATALDEEDGELTSFAWHSSIDGDFIPPLQLSVGEHIITVTVQDSVGHLASDGIEVVVQQYINQPPELTIISPEAESQANVESMITFEATAADIEDGDISASVQWASDLDGELGVGASINVSLTEGVHLITASVIDSDGADSAVSVGVDVQRVKIADVALVFEGQTGKYQEGFIHFDANITNLGPDLASDINLIINLPDDVEFSAVQPDENCSYENRIITCQLAALAVEGDFSYRVSVSTSDSAGLMGFSGEVSALEVDPDNENNVASKEFGGALNVFLLLILIAFGVVRTAGCLDK